MATGPANRRSMPCAKLVSVVGATTGFAPKATPKPIIDKLVDALDESLDDDVTRKRLLVLGCDIPDKPKRGPQPFLALVKSEIARWTPIIQAANVKVE